MRFVFTLNFEGVVSFGMVSPTHFEQLDNNPMLAA